MDAGAPICTPGFVLRTFEAIASLSAMIVVLTANGESKCVSTNAGPGSERCYAAMPYTLFGSVVFYIVIAFFTFFWCFLLILAHVFRKLQQPEFLQKHGEFIEYLIDGLFSLTNLLAYILMAIELNQSSPMVNQGKSPIEMSGDSSKYAYGMAIAFIMFVFFALNISHNLKLSTRTIDPSDNFDGNEGKYITRTFKKRPPPPRPPAPKTGETRRAAPPRPSRKSQNSWHENVPDSEQPRNNV